MLTHNFKVFDFPFSCFYSSNMNKPAFKIYFAHANGIPSITYRTLFERIINTTGACIFAYDMRGIGRSGHLPPYEEKGWTWDLISKEHVALFHEIPNTIQSPQLKSWFEDKSIPWLLLGHSLGAWISLFSSPQLHFKNVILLDPPILDWKTILAWNVCLVLKARHRHPMGMKVKKRRKVYPSKNEILISFKRSKLMKTWPDEIIQDYIEGSYTKDDATDNMLLRHDPEWEARLFETMPNTSATGFLSIPWKERLQIKSHFVVGEKSDTCNKDAKNYVKLFLPKSTWTIIKDGQHMFPIEKQSETIEVLKNIFSSTTQSAENKH